MTVSTDPFATNLGLMVHHYKPSVLLENWIAVFRFMVIVKVQKVNKCLVDIF